VKLPWVNWMWSMKMALSCMWSVLRKEKLLAPKFDLLLQACGFEKKSTSSMPSVSNDVLYWQKDNLHALKLLNMATEWESSTKNYVRSGVWGQKEIGLVCYYVLHIKKTKTISDYEFIKPLFFFSNKNFPLKSLVW